MFDEVHVYNALMLTSLRYFLRSVRYWQEYASRKSGFYFLSATFPPKTWGMLQEELGLTKDDRIEGVSYTGDVRLYVKPNTTITKDENPIARHIAEMGIETGMVGIFNAAYRAYQVYEALDHSLLFVGQEKMSETARRQNFDQFQHFPEDYALIGSPAIEAGVDFEARHLVIEESHQDSFVQRFGRAARNGKDALVLAYSSTLNTLAQKGLLAPQYTRADFLEELRAWVPRREPTRLFEGLAAYPYYRFWKQDMGGDFPMEPEHREMCERLAKMGVGDNLLPFRGLTPYTHYQTGESISYTTLFRKKLRLEDGKVVGAPHPERYFTTPKRPQPVLARVHDIFEQVRLGDNHLVMFAKVQFRNLGLKYKTHWVLLESSSF
ncbi:MAG: helicase-related protein [Anaerolineales bacterium]